VKDLGRYLKHPQVRVSAAPLSFGVVVHQYYDHRPKQHNHQKGSRKSWCSATSAISVQAFKWWAITLVWPAASGGPKAALGLQRAGDDGTGLTKTARVCVVVERLPVPRPVPVLRSVAFCRHQGGQHATKQPVDRRHRMAKRCPSPCG